MLDEAALASAPAGTADAAPGETEYIVTEPAPDALAPEWEMVRSGLSLMLAGAAVMVCCAFVFGAVVWWQGGVRAAGGGLRPAAVLSGLVLLAGYLGWWIGQFLCVAAPAEARLRVLTWANVAGQSVLVLLAVATLTLAAAPQPDLHRIALYFWLTLLGSVGGLLLHVLVLRGIARFFGDEGLARRVHAFLVLGLVLVATVAAYRVLWVVQMTRQPRAWLPASQVLVVWLQIVVLAVAGFLLIGYIRLLWQTRNLVRQALDDRGVRWFARASQRSTPAKAR